MVTAGVLALHQHAPGARPGAPGGRGPRPDAPGARRAGDAVAAEAGWRKVKELDPAERRGRPPAGARLPGRRRPGRGDEAVQRAGRQRRRADASAPPKPARTPRSRPCWRACSPAAARCSRGTWATPRTSCCWPRLARRITSGAASDRDRALLLCRWFALHVEPADPYGLPADPRTVVERGFGSPEQAACAYGELARQAGLDLRGGRARLRLGASSCRSIPAGRSRSSWTPAAAFR